LKVIIIITERVRKTRNGKEIERLKKIAIYLEG
jgi:hypothetical protein